ncbi:MAG: radical SAM protein [Dehalococcoidia bacterium]
MPSYSVTEKLSHTFELGPIRPPSEAYSLLIRATRNCPWNRCQFCPIYKGSKFELRPVAEIIRDIEAAKAISEGIKEMAWEMGHGDRVQEVAAALSGQPQYGQCVCHVAQWLATGGTSAFLQDSNTIIMRTPELSQVITFLRKTFPSLNRVTTYGRSHTAARKSSAELKELKDAGLDRVHIGLETGYDPLLAYMEKGCTAKDHIEGGKKIKEAGLSLCEYVMPGLGGKKMSQEHALETARVLNEIDPDYIRLRSLHVTPGMPLWTRIQDGDFELQTEDELVRELAVFVENLEVTSYLKSDHILNLLMEVEGKMPEDKEKCLNIISQYLSLPDEERLNFKFGRRAGYYNSLADLADSYKHDTIDQAIKRLKTRDDNVEEVLFRLKNSFL